MDYVFKHEHLLTIVGTQLLLPSLDCRVTGGSSYRHHGLIDDWLD